MFTLKHELETFFIILLVSFFSVFFITYNNNRNKNNFYVTSSIPSSLIITPTIVPTSALSSAFVTVAKAAIPTVNVAEQTSSDGKMLVTMQEKTNSDLTKTYSFYTSDMSGVNRTLIFTKTIISTSSMEIPFNTYSINDNYLFLKDNERDMTHYLLFNNSGALFGNEEQYLDISSLFSKYTKNYILHKVTGWASGTLLIVDTLNSDKTEGESFWFDTTNLSFTPLATKF